MFHFESIKSVLLPTVGTFFAHNVYQKCLINCCSRYSDGAVRPRRSITFDIRVATYLPACDESRAREMLTQLICHAISLYTLSPRFTGNCVFVCNQSYAPWKPVLTVHRFAYASSRLSLPTKNRQTFRRHFVLSTPRTPKPCDRCSAHRTVAAALSFASKQTARPLLRFTSLEVGGMHHRLAE